MTTQEDLLDAPALTFIAWRGISMGGSVSSSSRSLDAAILQGTSPQENDPAQIFAEEESDRTGSDDTVHQAASMEEVDLQSLIAQQQALWAPWLQEQNEIKGGFSFC